jgi:glucosamine--fructose-6-phosphate aminotransferase (isomerizing)
MNSMIAQINSLPELIRTDFTRLDEQVHVSLEPSLCRSIERLVLTGCGDSHHAALCSELAFEALAGLPSAVLTALQFSRYNVYCQSPQTAVVGISVSGEVARTIEALATARSQHLATIAITATAGSRLDEAADCRILSTTTTFPEPSGTVTPGVRTFITSLLCLYLAAIRLGELGGQIDTAQADALRQELRSMAEAVEQTIEAASPIAQALVQAWADASDFVFVGGGPNFGSALYCAAKILEASGDSAVGQDTEEWAHLQYFARETGTPTILISAGKADASRMAEIAAAARAIGRRIAIITPAGKLARLLPDSISRPAGIFTLPDGGREMFSPLVTVIPGMLLAATRAEQLGEPFFRGFGGGRSIVEGGGASRIRTSQMLQDH